MSEPAYAGIELQISEDGRSAVIALTTREGDTATVACDAASIDDFLEALSALRAQMTDEIPQALEPSARIPVIKDAAWWCEPQANGALACFRHPGFGWVAFALSASAAKSLAAQLQGDDS